MDEDPEIENISQRGLEVLVWVLYFERFTWGLNESVRKENENENLAIPLVSV